MEENVDLPEKANEALAELDDLAKNIADDQDAHKKGANG